MKKVFLSIVVVVLCCVLIAQDKTEHLKTRLHEIHKVLEELTQHPEAQSSLELQEKITILKKEAEEIEKQLSFADEQVLREHPKPDQPQEKMDKFSKAKAEIKKKTTQLRKELNKIDQQLLNSNMGEWEKLENKRAKIVAMIKQLNKKWNKVQQLQKKMKEKHHRRRNPREMMLEKIQKEFPEEFAYMEYLKNNSPREFRRKMPKMLREMQELQELQKQKPELYKLISEERKLSMRSEMLAHKIRGSKGEERQAMVADLNNILEQIFETKEKMRQREIDNIHEEAKKMQEKLEQRKANKKIIIERRIHEMIGEEDVWEW